MDINTSCTVQGCPCMERNGILAEIENVSTELLDISESLWVKYAAVVGTVNTVLLALLLLAK